MQTGDDIESVEEFTTANTDSFFRGISRYSYPLLPSIGRNVTMESRALRLTEHSMLKKFRRFGTAYLHDRDCTNLELMGIAQHHGMHTRMMDWTYSPLVALYFSVCEEHDEESAVFVADSERAVLAHNKAADPLNLMEDIWYVPPHSTPRITAQQALFSVQKNPLVAFDRGGLTKHRIKPSARKYIRYVLLRWGVNRASLFPGLDGIAANLNLTLRG